MVLFYSLALGTYVINCKMIFFAMISRLFSVISNMFMLVLEIKRLFHSLKRQWIFLLTVMLTLLIICILHKEIYRVPTVSPNMKTKTTRTLFKIMESQLSYQLLSDKGTGCEMPLLHHYSENIKNTNTSPTITSCGDENWVQCYKSECYVTDQILNKMKNIECVYRDIIFVRDDYQYLDEPIIILGGDKYQLVKSDHVSVTCTSIHDNGMGLILSSWSGNRAGLRPVPSSLDKSLNILLVVFDSMSRNRFIKKMPESYKALTEELNAVVLKGYNVVGKETPGALFPILTGHLELELDYSIKKLINNKYVNVKQFLFHQLKEQGYRTAYFNKMPRVGTLQSRFHEFEQQPTDHYLGPFLTEEYQIHQWTTKRKYCFGAEPQHRFLLNLTQQFFSLEGKKFCLSYFAEISHDDLITATDKDLVSFLRTFKKSGSLDDTMLIVMGDHGEKFASLKSTHQGKIQELLPFISIVLPQALKKERPDAEQNLIANVNVLTTHYDTHTTLLDVLGLIDYRNSYKIPGSDSERGLSYLEPIPNSRSCAEAGVMPNWCACANWLNVSQIDEMYYKSAFALAVYIDSITNETRSKCASRKLLKIEWVIRHMPNKMMLGYKRVRAAYEYYQVKIVMSPGRSLYEGSVRYKVMDEFFEILESYISRINSYGDEPKCVSATHPHLNKYCFCNDRLH